MSTLVVTALRVVCLAYLTAMPPQGVPIRGEGQAKTDFNTIDDEEIAEKHGEIRGNGQHIIKSGIESNDTKVLETCHPQCDGARERCLGQAGHPYFCFPRNKEGMTADKIVSDITEKFGQQCQQSVLKIKVAGDQVFGSLPIQDIENIFKYITGNKLFADELGLEGPLGGKCTVTIEKEAGPEFYKGDIVKVHNEGKVLKGEVTYGKTFRDQAAYLVRAENFIEGAHLWVHTTDGTIQFERKKVEKVPCEECMMDGNKWCYQLERSQHGRCLAPRAMCERLNGWGYADWAKLTPLKGEDLSDEKAQAQCKVANSSKATTDDVSQ